MRQCPGCTDASREHCRNCRSTLCPICGHPLYKDESIVNRGPGWQHVRCLGHRPNARPTYMPALGRSE